MINQENRIVLAWRAASVARCSGRWPCAAAPGDRMTWPILVSLALLLRGGWLLRPRALR